MCAESEVLESKVVYQDGDRIRSLQGKIASEDEFFITLTRDDGTFRIGKRFIIKIEELKPGVI